MTCFRHTAQPVRIQNQVLAFCPICRRESRRERFQRIGLAGRPKYSGRVECRLWSRLIGTVSFTWRLDGALNACDDLRGKSMECPECARLTVEFERLKRLYGVAVDRIFAIGYQVTDAEHEELKNFVEEARVRSEIAGMNLANHRLAVQSKAG
jgi:hypothetical protein